jgi:hypothetical protein
VKYFNRKQARVHLLERGVPVGVHTLAQLAVTGEGPRFRYWGRDAIYTEDDLDGWIEERLSATMRALAAVGRQRRRGRPPGSRRRQKNQPRQKPSPTSPPDARGNVQSTSARR